MILIGEGELRPEIEAQVRNYGLEEQVRLLGSRPDVLDLLACMDLFVSSSLWEGLPLEYRWWRLRFPAPKI